MAKRAIAGLLSFLIAFPPLFPVPSRAGEDKRTLKAGVTYAAGQPLTAEDLKDALDSVKRNFTEATLLRVDTKDLEARVRKLSLPDPAVASAWQAFQPLARQYDEFRGQVVSLKPQALVDKVRALGRGLELSPELVEKTLVPKYQQLQAVLAKNGVTSKDGVLLKSNGKPFTDGEWANFLQSRSPHLSASAQQELAAQNAKLFEVQQLAKTDPAAAVKKFDQILYGLSRRPDLLDGGFGSVPMETTLALIHATQETIQSNPGAVPKSDLDRLNQRLGAVDGQLQGIASKKIAVPALQPSEKGPPPPMSNRTKAELAFYAALSHLPLTSGAAKEKFFEADTAELLRKTPGVAQYAFGDKDPSGKVRKGVYVTMKDGSKRYESMDGLSVATSADGKTVVTQDQARGFYEKSVDGKEVVSWEKDPKTGGIKGRFLGLMVFDAAKDEAVIFSSDGGKLFIAKGFDKDGKPVIDRWIGFHERGWNLPNGMGHVVSHFEGGKHHDDVVLNPELLKTAASGGEVDLSAIPERFLDAKTREQYARFLKDLPQFGELFRASMGQNTASRDGVEQSNWVEALYIRDGMLNMVLGEKFSQGGKSRPPSYSHRIAAVVEKGALKAYIFANQTTFLWKFNPEMTVCDQFNPDAEAGLEGKAAFNLGRHYEKEGSKWVLKKNYPLKLKEWTTWDSIKAVGSGALGAVGEGVGVVFSPFQTALYGIEGSIWLGGGALANNSFAKAAGVYTLRQAKFNEWLGQGVKGEGRILEAYGQALQVSDAQGKKDLENFLDGEIEKMRRKQYGELYRFHKDDPVGYKDRAYAAAQTFGLANLPGQYFQSGQEAWAQGNKWAAVGNYAAGAFVIGGEAYVEGFGFGLAAQPLKMAAIGGRTGMTSEQVAKAVEKGNAIRRGAKGLELTASEAKAVQMLKWVNRAEMTAFMGPAGANGIVDVYGLYDSWKKGDKEGMTAHLDGIVSNASGFMGVGMGLVSARISSFAALRSKAPPPIEAPKPVETKAPGEPPPSPFKIERRAPNELLERLTQAVLKPSAEAKSSATAAKPLPQRPSGDLRLAGQEKPLRVTLDRKPGQMEATFLASDADGRGLAVKSAKYVGIEAKSLAEQRAAVEREYKLLQDVRRLVKEGGFPDNFDVPEPVGIGEMDAALAKTIYREGGRVPVLVMKKAPGVTISRWLDSGKSLRLGDWARFAEGLRKLQALGVHGDLNTGNILIVQDPVTGRQSFTLIDFGAFKRLSELPPGREAEFKAQDLQELKDIAGYFKDAGRLRSELVPPSAIPKPPPAGSQRPPNWGKNNASDIPSRGLIGKITGAPLVDAGKQGKHVRGHPNNSDPNRSVWVEGVDHVALTQKAWMEGAAVPDQPQARSYDAGRAVGAAGETWIKVHMDSEGRIHGVPIKRGSPR